MLLNWCWRRLFESPLDSKEIQAVNPKGNRPWIFIGRTDLKLKLQYFGDLITKSWFIRKDLDAGKDWGQAETVALEDEIFRWNHWLNRHEFDTRNWWWTRKPGGLQSMGLQRVGLDITEQLKKNNIDLGLKTFNKVGIEGTHLYIIKTIYGKHTDSIIHNCEKLKAFPLRSGMKQGCPLLPL